MVNLQLHVVYVYNGVQVLRVDGTILLWEPLKSPGTRASCPQELWKQGVILTFVESKKEFLKVPIC